MALSGSKIGNSNSLYKLDILELQMKVWGDAHIDFSQFSVKMTLNP